MVGGSGERKMGNMFTKKFLTKVGDQSKLGCKRWCIELYEHTKHWLPGRGWPQTSSYTPREFIVRADTLGEAIERAKDKWVELNKQERARGCQIYYSYWSILKGEEVATSARIPKVMKRHMGVDDHRELKIDD